MADEAPMSATTSGPLSQPDFGFIESVISSVLKAAADTPSGPASSSSAEVAYG